jgi:hypothetical protein
MAMTSWAATGTLCGALRMFCAGRAALSCYSAPVIARSGVTVTRLLCAPLPIQNVPKYRTAIPGIDFIQTKILGQAFILGDQGAILGLVLLWHVMCVFNVSCAARRRAAENPHSTAWDHYLLAKVRLAQFERYLVFFSIRPWHPCRTLLTYC